MRVLCGSVAGLVHAVTAVGRVLQLAPQRVAYVHQLVVDVALQRLSKQRVHSGRLRGGEKGGRESRGRQRRVESRRAV